jgi:hypothetical protein
VTKMAMQREAGFTYLIAELEYGIFHLTHSLAS